jgi:hypothetical protein
MKVDADNFCGTLHANVNNPNLSDKDFRAFVRHTLPIVVYMRPMCDLERLHGEKCRCTCLHTTHPVGNHSAVCPENRSKQRA